MKKTKMFLTAVLLLASTWLVKSQSCSSGSCSIPSCELICNGSFEFMSSVPTGQSQLTNSCGWLVANKTPDLFSTTATGNLAIPCNFTGSLSAANTGSVCVGFIAYVTGNFGWQERIAVKLKSALIVSQPYEISFYLALSSSSNNNADNVYIYLDEAANSGNNSGLISVNTSTQTLGWTKFTFTYTPFSGGEDQLTIGATGSSPTFYAAAHTASDCVTNPISYGPSHKTTYYYLDDVSIRKIVNGPSIVASSTTGCVGESFTLTASGADSYTWAPASGLSCTNCASPISTTTTPTTYTVTGISSDGCIVTPPTATITISPYACCTNSNTTNNFTLRDVTLVPFGTGGATTWASLSPGNYYTGNVAVPTATTITNYTFTVVNKMTISTPVTFSLCNICICEDDTIIQNDLTFIKRSWLWGDKLWEGIVSTKRLEVTNSFIEDAYQGIKAGNGATYDGLICDNVVFNKNYNSIVAATGDVSPSDFNITGCVFTSRAISSALHDFTPPRYTTSLAPIGSKVPAKIKGSTIHTITNNTIRSNIGMRIVGFASTSATILNIGETSGTPATNASYTNYFDHLNCGIYNLWSKLFIRNNSFGNISTTSLGTAIGAIVHDDLNFFTDPKITKTKVGDAVGGSIYKNTFTSVKDGVVGINSGTLEVSGNDFLTVSRYGVSVSTWSSSVTQLEPVTVSSNSYTDCLYPFYAYDNNYIKASIANNTVVHIQPTYTAGYCAYINELSKPANGTYSITSNVYSGMLNGIYVTNTSGTRIVGNTVTVKKPGVGVFNAGVTLANVDNSIVSDNILACNPTNSGSWYTFGILGSTSASNTLQCNTITKSGICIKFQGAGSPNYIHNNSLNQTATADPCLFGVVLDQGANIGHIGHWSGSVWEKSDDIWGDFLYGSPNNGADTYVQGINPNYSVGGNIYYDAGAAPTGDYTPGVNLFAIGNTAFSAVSNNNTNGNSCGIGARLANTETGGGKTIGSGSDMNTVPKKRIILNNGNKANREITGNESSFSLVDSLLMDYIATRNSGSLNNAKNTNTSIIAANNIEQNQKDFNAIYAVYLEDDSLINTNQIQELVTMSQLCPFTDGLAVYQARAMMRCWDDSTFFYNECEINVPTQEEHERNIANSLTENNIITEVYPNPANNSVMVKTNLNNCIMVVYDIIGKHILTQKLNENETKIDVTSFNNGTYLYKITDTSNKVMKNGKFIISH